MATVEVKVGADNATTTVKVEENKGNTTEHHTTDEPGIPETTAWICTIVIVGLSIAVLFANYFYIQWAIAFGINWVVFSFYAWPFHTEKLYDFTGMITFISVLTYSFVSEGAYNYVRCILVYIFVMLWTLRLGTFLLDRILGESGKDARFNQVRNNFSRFFMMWSFQGAWVFFVLYTALVINHQTKDNNVTAADIVGWIIFWVGWLTEILSDRQKTNFKKNPDNRGKFITTGLWKYSRHPNYFGEIVLWIGIFICATSVARKWEYVMVISPIWTMILLIFLSGIPIAEKGSDARYGTREDYKQYKNNTPVLIPFFYCWK